VLFTAMTGQITGSSGRIWSLKVLANINGIDRARQAAVTGREPAVQVAKG